MKKSQKCFAMLVLLVVIGLLIVGGGIYVYEGKKAKTPAVSQIANWETVSGSYGSIDYQFKLPPDFKEKEERASLDWHHRSFDNNAYYFSIIVEPVTRLSSFIESPLTGSLAQVANAIDDRDTYDSVIEQREIKVAGAQALLQDSASLSDIGGSVYLSTVLLAGDNFIVLTLQPKQQNVWGDVKDKSFVNGILTQNVRGLNGQILSTFKMDGVLTLEFAYGSDVFALKKVVVSTGINVYEHRAGDTSTARVYNFAHNDPTVYARGVLGGIDTRLFVIWRGSGANIVEPILFAFRKNGGVWKQVAYIKLPPDGGRTTIESFSVQNDSVVLDVKTSGPDRNYHETYVPKHYVYKLSGNQLLLQ